MAKILMVIAPEEYQEIEYGTPKQILEEHGHTIITTSTVNEAQGHMGNTTTVDLLINEAKADNYDAVIFVGGGGAQFYFTNEPALTLAKDFYNQQKLTCAICAAPSILANAGILGGKTVTSFPSQENNLIEKGADYTSNPVEKDGNIITANGPQSATQFAEKINESLSQIASISQKT